MIAFDVFGVPAPKGSSRAILIGGRARLAPYSSDSNRRAVKAWERAVADACRATIGTPPPGLDDATPFHRDAALSVTITFHVARSKAAQRRARPNTRPDADKLARATLDALTGVLWTDDGRIADLMVSKVWAQPGGEGAHITVTEAR